MTDHVRTEQAAAFCPDQLACLVAHVGLDPTVEPAIPRWSFLVEAG